MKFGQTLCGLKALLLGCTLCCIAENVVADDGVSRVTAGLQVLYDFQSDQGDQVSDRSGVEPSLDLKLTDTKQVRRADGTLELTGKAVAKSNGKALKILYAVQWTGEISIETWIKPASTKQTGPARILTYSRNSNERNFTLGQDGDLYDVRFRTSGTSQNGLPSISTKKGSLKPELTHVVYVRDRSGLTRIYLNGKVAAEMNVPGEIAWESQCEFALGDELNGGRQWHGTYHLAAIYNRALLPHEVDQNFRAGANPNAKASGEKLSPNQQRFVSRIAPIMAEHCLECHDTVNREGGLDLSRRDAAFTGDSGKSIVPGNLKKSPLWEFVESDEMPHKREPLSDEEKQVLKQWIADGADWPLEVIEPTFAHGGSAQGIFVRRLTVSEYIETVRTAVGVDIHDQASELLPGDLRADGFKNTAYNLSVDLKHIQAYARLAEMIADKIDYTAFSRDHSRHKQLTEKNLRESIADVAKWMFRGPISDRELNLIMSVAEDVIARGGKAEDAMRLTVETMLQSPRFIYLVENQRGDGTLWPVSPHELACRMSYMLWGAPPDKDLIKAAEEGDLYDSNQLRGQIERMLSDPRAVDRSKEFVSQWLDLDRLANLKPDPKRFPHWNAKLAAEMQRETIAFFEDVAWKEKRPLTGLISANFTYASPELAAHYDLKIPDDKKNAGMIRYDLSDVPGRGGLLTHASVLTVGGDDASMVSRGLFVLTDLLRGSVKDPPPCVNTVPPPTKPGLTQRGIASERIANNNCGGCHVKFEPLAFGLEKFDGIGKFHEQDEFGNKLRDDGEILFPGTKEPVAYANSAEMMKILADSERVRECISWKVAQFALGRPLTAADAPIIKQIDIRSHENGGTYQSLMTEIMMSDLVRMTQTEGYQQ